MEKIWEQKKIGSVLGDMSRFSVEEKQKHEFEHYVDLTSKLIKRSYIQTFRMVENWPLEKIIRHYELCTKHCEGMPGDVKWWWLRKKEKRGWITLVTKKLMIFNQLLLKAICF